MFDTHVTIVGNALHEPEWRKTVTTGAMVTTFKIASTARRLNRETGQWIDGNSLRVRVTCWRSLASNVKNSVTRGDPLIVTGRLFTRDWTDEHGVKRTQYELEASAVGHDLNRGRTVFERHRANTSTSAVEDPQAQARVGGELTTRVPDHEAPSRFDATPYDAAQDRVSRAPAEPVAAGGGHPAAYPAGPAAAADPDALSPVIEDEEEPEPEPVEPAPLDDAVEVTGPQAVAAYPEFAEVGGVRDSTAAAMVGDPASDPVSDPASGMVGDPASGMVGDQAGGADEAGRPAPGRRRGSRRVRVPA